LSVRTSQIALAVVLLVAAGCRDVLGIHAASSNRDSGVFDPATNLDAGTDASSPPPAVDGGDGSGSDDASGESGAAGKKNTESGEGGHSGRSSIAAPSGGGAGSAGAASGGEAGQAGEPVSGRSGAGSGNAGRGAAGSGGAAGMAGGSAGGPSCSDVCSLGDLQCLSSSELQVCGLVDGCLVWTTVTPCGDRQMCVENGPTASCVCQPAPSGCESGPGSFCSSAARLDTCVADDEGCIYKASTTSCPTGKPCAGAHPAASCSCDEPDDCKGVIGGVCRNPSQAVTCARNSAGCLEITGTETCPSGTSCQGTPGGADCKCPAAPAVCVGVTAGNVCQSDTSFAHCTSDTHGCVTATAGTCNALQPCRGNAGAAECTCLNPPTTSQCPGNASDGSRCSGGSLFRCGNDAAGCLRFMQSECATGVCGGTYPTAACVEEEAIGWPKDLGSMQLHTTGALTGTSITVSAPAVLRRFGILSRAAGAQAILVLYDDLGGKPHNRVAATSSNTLAVGVNEFAVALPPTQVVLSPGTYWLMLSIDSMTQLAHGTSAVPLAFVSYTHGSPIPSPLTSVSLDSMPEQNFYVVVLPQ
jgi:hypothetical protein